MSDEDRVEMMRQFDIEMDRLKREKAVLDAKTRHEEEHLAILRSMRETLDRWMAGEIHWERPDGSATYKLKAALKGGIVVGAEEMDAMLSTPHAAALEAAVPFVVEHDWASAFANAIDFADGEYKLPFDTVVFEFRADGIRVFVLLSDSAAATFLHQKDCWYAVPFGDDGMLSKQIRAISIALDAEVAVSDTVRAPEALNRHRLKRGKLPLVDYHVVRLARRSQAAPLPDEEHEAGTRRRLHFVRGHWRHYETHKTWIKWHLRGDPDLGFIDKHYRL